MVRHTSEVKCSGDRPFPQKIANHPLKRTYGESPRTTRLYDHRSDAISLDEIERRLIRLRTAAGHARGGKAKIGRSPEALAVV
jgi:hypothetical protein